MGPIRALMLAGLAAVTLTACKDKTTASNEDMTQGSATAPIKMIEYGSVACPHCARFNNEVFPAFKTKYIDTGKVEYTLREALTGEPPQLAAAGFLIARCAGKDEYFAVVDAIFRDQPNIQQNMREGLLRVAQASGLSEDQFNKCIQDEKAIDALNKRAERMTAAGITGTPAFLFNGKEFAQSELTLEDLDKAVAQATAAGPAK